MYINNELYRNDIKRIIDDKFAPLKNKTLLITGSSGLIGSFLIDTIMLLNKEQNYNTKSIANFSSKKSLEERFKSYKNENLFYPLIQDINQPINCSEEIEKDCVKAQQKGERGNEGFFKIVHT